MRDQFAIALPAHPRNAAEERRRNSIEMLLFPDPSGTHDDEEVRDFTEIDLLPGAKINPDFRPERPHASVASSSTSSKRSRRASTGATSWRQMK